MKAALLCALVALTLVGCVRRAEADQSSTGAGYNLITYTDAETGCEYLKPTGEGGITPRIAADGKTHMGCKGAAK